MNPQFGLPSRKKAQEDGPSDQNQYDRYPYNDQETSGEHTFISGATNPYAVPPASMPPQSNGPRSTQASPNWQDANVSIDEMAGRSSFHAGQTELFNVPTHPLGRTGSLPASSSMPPQRPQRRRRNPLLIGMIAVVLVVALAGGGGLALMHSLSSQKAQVNKPAPTPTTPPPATATPTPRVNPVSPLLFGTNLELYDTKDQALTSAKTQQLFQQINLRIIRMPMRADGTMAPEFAGARVIKQLGAIPLVILHGDARVSTALEDDTLMIQEMNKIFGDSLVYYEYGNEQDLNGVNMQKYTASWNRVVPQLKKIANNANFVGPVNYHYDQNYLQYFLQNANPRPDEVSWHEYTCDKSWAQETCLQHIDNWSKHISSARGVMKQTVGSELPIMITEWNYAPNPTLSDGKISDSTFMNTWTTKAFQVLAANRIFASMIYAGTHPVFPLVAQDATLTIQGSVFKSEYQTMITQGKVPVALNGSDSGTQSTQNSQQTGNEKTVFSFEQGGADQWKASQNGITKIGIGSVARTGNASLQVSLAKLGQGDSPTVFANVSGNAPHAGQSVAGYVYLASNAISLSARMVVIDQNGQSHAGGVVTLNPGEWTRVAFSLPSSFSGQAKQIGIQFSSPGDNVTGADVYIDDVGWN